MRLAAALLGAAIFALPAVARAQGYSSYAAGSGCQGNAQLEQLMQQREALNDQISQADYYRNYDSAHQLSAQLDQVNQEIGSFGPNGCGGGNGSAAQGAPPSAYGPNAGGYNGYASNPAPAGYNAPYGGGAQAPAAYSAYGAPNGGYNQGGAPNGNSAASSPLTSMLAPLLQGFLH
jgi:hypothetical protein